jgi:hypothetical protein
MSCIGDPAEIIVPDTASKEAAAVECGRCLQQTPMMIPWAEFFKPGINDTDKNDGGVGLHSIIDSLDEIGGSRNQYYMTITPGLECLVRLPTIH